MKKVYFICPACEKVTTDVSEFSVCRQRILESEIFEDLAEEIVLEFIDGEKHCLKHFTCGNIMENMTVRDIAVIVEDGRIVYVGDYWKFENEDTLLAKIIAEAI